MYIYPHPVEELIEAERTNIIKNKIKRWRRQYPAFIKAMLNDKAFFATGKINMAYVCTTAHIGKKKFKSIMAELAEDGFNESGG